MSNTTTPRLSRLAKCLGVVAVLLVLAAACIRFEVFASPAAPPSPGWGDVLMLGDALPLENVPVIVSTVRTGDALTVRVANEGATTLTYSSVGPSLIQSFEELEELGEWVPGNWDWCGTGMQDFELRPGGKVELAVEFWEARRERMLACFTEKGSQRCGLVVLASETGRLVPNGDHLILLSGASAAAFCVWLGIRAINCPERWARWFAAGPPALLPICYVLSIGPAAWGVEKGYVSAGFFQSFYAPANWICEQSEPCSTVLLTYVSYWAQ